MSQNISKPIIIADRSVGDYLFAIATAGINNKELKLQYMDRHAGQVEILLRLLRKSFGWTEIERRVEMAKNTSCRHKDQKTGNCTNVAIDYKGKCTDLIWPNCKGYDQKYKHEFKVNEVIIQQSGSIIDL